MAISPDRYSVHVDRPNSTILVAQMQPDSVYIHDRVFASVPVPKQSDLYYSMPPDGWFRSGAQKRAPGTETPGVIYNVSPNNRYSCDVVGVHVDLSDQLAANYDAPLDPERDSAMLLAKHIKIRKEIDWVQRYFQMGVWTGFRVGGNTVSDFDCTQSYSHGQWDLPNSDPIRDITYMMDFMMSQTGYKPNVLVLAKNVYSALRNNPAVYGRYIGVIPQIMDEDLLKKALGVEEIIIAEAVLNNSQEGQAKSMGFLLSNTFLLCYKTKTPSIMAPTAGYTFEWVGYPGANGLTAVVRQFRMEEIRSTRMEAEAAYDFKIVSSDMGILGKNVLKVA